MRTMARRAVVPVALVVLGTGPTLAADTPVIGRKFLAKTACTPGPCIRLPHVSALAKDFNVVVPAKGSAGDPTCTGPGGGGATLEVRAGNNVGKWALPCGGWAYDGSGTALTYRNRNVPTGGGVQLVRIRQHAAPVVRPPGLLMGLARTLGENGMLFTVPTSPQDVSVTLTTGSGQRYCMRFPPGSTVRADGKTYLAKRPGVAGTCPSTTTTTTTAPTTVPGTTLP